MMDPALKWYCEFDFPAKKNPRIVIRRIYHLTPYRRPSLLHNLNKLSGHRQSFYVAPSPACVYVFVYCQMGNGVGAPHERRVSLCMRLGGQGRQAACGRANELSDIS